MSLGSELYGAGEHPLWWWNTTGLLPFPCTVRSWWLNHAVLKNTVYARQMGNLPQMGCKWKHDWNQHLRPSSQDHEIGKKRIPGSSFTGLSCMIVISFRHDFETSILRKNQQLQGWLEHVSFSLSLRGEALKIPVEDSYGHNRWFPLIWNSPTQVGLFKLYQTVSMFKDFHHFGYHLSIIVEVWEPSEASHPPCRHRNHCLTAGLWGILCPVLNGTEVVSQWWKSNGILRLTVFHPACLMKLKWCQYYKQ